jgi:transposase InsO family protein
MATRNAVLADHLVDWRASRGNKEKRGVVLTHLAKTLKVHRKGIGRSMQRLALRQSDRHLERRGRTIYYTKDVDAALYDIWKVSSEACGENLHGMVTEYIDVLLRDNLWKHNDEATGKLRAMSEGTMKRRVGLFFRKYYPNKGKSTTNPSSLHALIPTRRDGWSESPIGTMQVDTVAHCGGSVAGDFIYTVNATDVNTLWGTRRAQWNKGQEATLTNMKFMRADLPTHVVEWHPDSGSEFINWLCREWCAEEGILLTRSRPNKKNDNCFVEERNGHVVRKYLGTIRLDAHECVEALNELYDVLTPYLNHWVAVRRSYKDGDKKKRESHASTPYARMLLRDDVPTDTKEKLRVEHAASNPLVMKAEIDRRLKRVINLQKHFGTTLFVG